jgi:hypothetical protein
MIRRIVQRHLFLLLSGTLMLGVFFLAGFGLMRYPGIGTLMGVIDNNHLYLMAWRVLMYITVIIYWPRLINMIALRRNCSPLTEKAERRGPVIWVCLAFELFIVQNVIGVLLAAAGVSG